LQPRQCRLVAALKQAAQTRGYADYVAVLLLFASAREACGTGRSEIDAPTVGAVIEAAKLRFGERFVEVLPTCKIWLNGEEVHESTPVTGNDEVAVLPPVSGGSQ
jgi:sulfur-carrier protein